MTLRLWLDLDLSDDPADAAGLLAAAAHPNVRLVGISTNGAAALEGAEIARSLLSAAARPVPLVYAGAPDPRALAAADALLALGPPTNLADLLRASVELPPTAVLASRFGDDPLAAAILVANGDDLLVVPDDIVEALPVGRGRPAALLALLGEHVRVERRSLAVTVVGSLVVDDRDGTEHDVVVDTDTHAARVRIAMLLS